MVKRLKNLDPNLRLKIMSVIIAMAVWYMINYFSDPVMRMTVSNVNVEILHGEAIENKGDVYTVLDDTDIIPSVTIHAKRSVIDKLEAKNVIATADARQIEDDGSIRISLMTDKYANSIEQITGSISYVQLRVEPQMTKSLPIEVETSGDPADGYILYETSAEQNQVIISGPQSYVEELGRAVARVEITGSEKSIKSTPEIILYDNEGDEITSEEMKSQKLHLNISSVKVAATIYQLKNVAITCGTEVPLADGYELASNPAADPSSIQIAGAAGSLRDFSVIEIPVEDFAPDPVNKNIHKSIGIKKYLPEGIVLPYSDVGNITVYVRVLKKAPEKSDTSDTSESAESSAEQETEGT